MVDWTEVLIAGVGILFTAIIIPLAKAAFDWLKGKTKNEAIQSALSEAEKIADQTVLGLKQTLVDGLKAAHADGKLTAEEITTVSGKALSLFVDSVSVKTIETLDANIEDVEGYIKNLIESRIAKLKS